MEQNATFWSLNEVQAIFISTAVAALIAVWSIFSQRAISARRATLEFIKHSESDKDLIDARKTFIKLAKSPEGLWKWADDQHQTSDEARSIRTVLNEHELVAIAIQRGILDDTTYRRFYQSTIVARWRHAAPYILARRSKSGNQAYYHEFEEMARWYQGGNGMPRRRFFWRKFI